MPRIQGFSKDEETKTTDQGQGPKESGYDNYLTGFMLAKHNVGLQGNGGIVLFLLLDVLI